MTYLKRETKREKCDWECIGENTAGFVYWCSKCGSVVSEDNSDLQTPSGYDDETNLCYDRGIVP